MRVSSVKQMNCDGMYHRWTDDTCSQTSNSGSWDASAPDQRFDSLVTIGTREDGESDSRETQMERSVWNSQ